MTGVVRAVLLLTFLGAADAVRVRQEMILEGGVQSSHQLALDKLAGQRWGKYVLQTHIESHHLSFDEGNAFDSASEVDGGSVYSSLLEDRAGTFANESVIPPRRFTHDKYTLGRLLGKGSFGAAFSATVDGDSSERVVLKFIYTFRDENLQIVTGTVDDRDEFGEQLKDLEDECNELEKVQRAADRNALGASRLIKCYARCFRRPITPSACSTGIRDPQFIVMDDGGQNGEEWLRDHSNNKDAIAEVLQQVAQGLDYLTAYLDPPLIHHDLKWDNIAVRFREGRGARSDTIDVKLIDFGAAIEKTQASSPEGSVCTPGFGPPEWEYGFCYFGPASAFDVYSLGAMALHGLCEVWGQDLDIVARKGRAVFETVEIRGKEPSGAILDLIGLKSLLSGNRDCRVSMEMLVHPLPAMRLLPSQVEFTTTGALTRAGAFFDVDNGLPEPPSGTLASLLKNVDSVASVVSNWDDLLYPEQRPSSNCMEQRKVGGLGPRFKRMLGALQKPENETDDLYTLADKIPDFLRKEMVDDQLCPFSEADDRLLVGCVLNEATNLGGAERGYRTSTAQAMMALLQWGELWKDPPPETTLPGSMFARELIWGNPTTSVVFQDFKRMLDDVAHKAYTLYKAAGNAAVPSWKSGVTSFFSAAVTKRYRNLYRRVYYLVQARLQAAALRVSCSVNMARQAGPLLKLLMDGGHEEMEIIKRATVSSRKRYFKHASTRLVKVKESANELRLAFLKVSDHGELHSNLPPLTAFEKALPIGWDDTESFAARSTAENGFQYPGAESKGAPVCPDSDIVAWELSAQAALSKGDPMLLQGMYQAFKEAVVDNLQQGIDGIYEVLAYEERHSGRPQRSFKLGTAMQADVQAAADVLADFVRSPTGTGDYTDRDENRVNIELNVLDKVYHKSNDEEYDALGVGRSGGDQPGVIFHVKQLISAAHNVKVHPSQDA